MVFPLLAEASESKNKNDKKQENTMHFQSFIPKLCVISHTHQELNLSHLHITSFKPWFKRPFFQRDLGIGYVTQRPNKHKQCPFEEHEVFLETPKSLK